jgi:hypothetical protein
MALGRRTPVSSHGDVDADGQVVDSARVDRLRGAVACTDAAVSYDPEAQLELTLVLLEQARSRRAAA